MQLSVCKTYKYKEIKDILTACPVCRLDDQLAINSSVENGTALKGRDSIACARCKLQLSFIFHLDRFNEIVDAYKLDFFKLGNLEFKNTRDGLALYLNNTYVKDIDTNIVDLDKCMSLLMLS